MLYYNNKENRFLISNQRTFTENDVTFLLF